MYKRQVGAYDPRLSSYARFSGRGYTRILHEIKPDLAAPGVNIPAPRSGGGYASFNTFETGIILQNGFSDKLGYGKAWCYPCAYEADHKLYIIYTVYLENEKRGAALSVVPLI